ncbi:4-aminobutyrate aminotransferase/(S)-3-amino-2-methylpropionate transaminase [Aurantimicrobium minutum]|uniref:4-aminobutyrate--2-oxoglutarate transaminase n=1 Tax=Aurantimicrobium minutum TaxID=708131 RepID=UPI0024736A6D|nr:4-aminobutyrate--2-oxoglutarate transaminase [Aurantimicrobium minutum]MDH6255359.1 4-aminobutyrate aminotransferase/(S)-3-amino-2-methylpropionate transaminase [Aurantimicrobium minutum]MDH6409497.1 4-aminobutyrate aminotransferase/(S)-3-amino-2-methylpropionate transaminase [Aurantimicrobium minutum]MDH6425039.1 4-aminobutyrate aminotransferase/(S)-3-amino-2-methylpropionate transaminase [Aurantimicrobium minutum]
MSNTSAPASVAVTQERKVVTAIPGPKSQEMHKRRAEVVPPGVGAALPVYIENAYGSIVQDVDGNQFIDFATGIGVTTIGHANDAVVAAVAEAAAHFTHVCFTVTPYEGYVKVAELLAKHTPGNHAKRTMLCNSGAEAVENAVKIARKYTRKNGVAVLDHAYHGRTNLTMSMNFKNAPYATGFGPTAPSIFRAPSSYPYRDGLTGAEAAKRTITYLEKIVGAEDLAVVFAEPIQGEGGFIVPADGYLPAIQEWCTKNNVVFVADEVQAGMARTGAYFASEGFGFVPDLVTIAKGVGGGMPIAAVTGRAEIMDASHPGGLGGTFGGNPVSCAAAIAIFSEIEKDNLLDEAKRVEKTLGGGLKKLQEKYPVIGEVRGKGAMLAIELVQPGTKDPNAEAVTKIVAFGAQHGLLLLSAGTYGNVLRFLPSVKTSDALLEDALGVLDEALASL